MEIEHKSFQQPYEREIFESFLDYPLFVVALYEDRVIGYAIATGNGLIVSIAVRPEYRRKGIGKKLLDNLLSSIDPKKITLTLRVSNKGAYEFYKKMGFTSSGIIHNYYEDSEDAILMVIYG